MHWQYFFNIEINVKPIASHCLLRIIVIGIAMSRRLLCARIQSIKTLWRPEENFVRKTFVRKILRNEENVKNTYFVNTLPNWLMLYFKYTMILQEHSRALVVAQLSERLFLKSEVRSANPVIGKIYNEHFLLKKRKQRKRGWKWPIK